MIPDDDTALLNLAADLLYDTGDERAMPWPDPQTLGHIRSRIRGLADWHEAHDVDALDLP